MKSGQIKSLEEPFLSLKKVVSEDDATKSGYKRLPQSERVQRAIEAACEHAEEKFGEKTPAWVLWIREHRAIVGGVWRCVFLVGKVYLWLYARLATAVRALYAVREEEGPAEQSLQPQRAQLHAALGLPVDRPLLRSSNALGCAAGAGGRPFPGLLTNVHEGLAPSGVKAGEASLVQGECERF